jgi:hypothetical protein
MRVVCLKKSTPFVSVHLSDLSERVKNVTIPELSLHKLLIGDRPGLSDFQGGSPILSGKVRFDYGTAFSGLQNLN